VSFLENSSVATLFKRSYRHLVKHKFFYGYLVFALLTSVFLLLLPGYVERQMVKDVSETVGEQIGEEDKNSQEIVLEKAVEILEVSLNYNSSRENPLSITGVAKKNGYPPQAMKDSDYQLVIYQDNSVFYKTSFSVPNKVIGPPPLPGSEGEEESGAAILEKTDFVIVVPFDENADKIEIKNKSNEVVASYALENLKEEERDVKVETKKGDVLSVTTDILSTVVKASTWFVSDVNAQTNGGYVDVVLVSEDYQASQLGEFKKDVNRFVNHMLSYEPYKNRSSQFLFHIVENTRDLGCTFNGRIIVCNNAQVMSVVNSASVPSDVVAVLINNESYGGSAFYPANGNPGIAATYTGEQWGAEVFVHEIGHALGLLVDEYIANNSYEPGDKNCRGDNGVDASQWEELTGGNVYINGCNFPNWFRSTETSIMKSVDARYFNQISQHFLNLAINGFAGEYVTPTVTPSETPSVIVTTTETPTTTPTPSTGTIATNTPTASLTGSSTSTPTQTPTNTPTFTSTPTPTTQLNCFKGITIYLDTNTHVVSRGDTINNNLNIKNNNDVGCGPTAPLGISHSRPTAWDLSQIPPSVSVNAGETVQVSFSIYITQSADLGTHLYQFWVSSWGPVNGTVTVQ
jgi:hypothetical protein